MDSVAVRLLAHRRVVLALWVLLCLIGAVFAAGLPGRIVSGGEAPDSSQSEQVARALAASPVPSLFVAVQVPPDATPLQLAEATDAVAGAVRATKNVVAVTPKPAVTPVELAGARVNVLDVSTSGGTDGAVHVAHELSGSLTDVVPAGTDVHVGGFGAYRDELTVASQHDLERAERVGIPIVLIVLLLTFGSLWASLLPLAIALSALVLGLGVVGAASFVLPMSDFVTNSASLIGLALGVDYAMFLVQRVRELARSGLTVDAAVRKAMSTTGEAVLWSGITVVLAEATLFLVDSRSIRSAAFGMVVVTLCAIGTALLVAPVLISLLGERVVKTQWRSPSTESRGWARWARHVTRHGPIWLVVSALALLMLAIPATKLHSKVSISGTSSLPANSSVRQAYEEAAQRYGAPALSPVVVIVPAGGAESPASVAGRVAADPAVARVDTQALPEGATAVVVTTKVDPYSAQARDLVHRIRADHNVLVGGETASSIDATQAMFDGLPKVGIALGVVVLLLLLFALRSVFLPVKAVVLVVLSLGASLGSLVLLTTTSWGAKIIGADGPQDIHPIVPITIIAITVALSTDYEVMLISRIKEHYVRTGDNRASVVSGIEHTGSVITSAAAIMVAVFVGFALADLPPLKQLGVGLALAVVLDATVVRAVLVPAAMAVMGRGNWWWPGATPVAATGGPSPSPDLTVPARTLDRPRTGPRHSRPARRDDAPPPVAEPPVGTLPVPPPVAVPPVGTLPVPPPVAVPLPAGPPPVAVPLPAEPPPVAVPLPAVPPPVAVPLPAVPRSTPAPSLTTAITVPPPVRAGRRNGAPVVPVRLPSR